LLNLLISKLQLKNTWKISSKLKVIFSKTRMLVLVFHDFSPPHLLPPKKEFDFGTETRSPQTKPEYSTAYPPSGWRNLVWSAPNGVDWHLSKNNFLWNRGDFFKRFFFQAKILVFIRFLREFEKFIHFHVLSIALLFLQTECKFAAAYLMDSTAYLLEVPLGSFEIKPGERTTYSKGFSLQEVSKKSRFPFRSTFELNLIICTAALLAATLARAECWKTCILSHNWQPLVFWMCIAVKKTMSRTPEISKRAIFLPGLED